MIFTEHKECVMTVAELRDLLRFSFLTGCAAATTSVPPTFLAETFLTNTERQLRKFKKDLTAEKIELVLGSTAIMPIERRK
jgi:hypothetical protein